jgi:Domain of unknown function (DUF1772)
MVGPVDGTDALMILKIAEIVSIVITALAAGMFFGPWLALTISIRTFAPDVFLAIVGRLNTNMARTMTALLPLALLSMIPVLFFSYRVQPNMFVTTLAAFALFVAALLVTMLVEVPIVQQIVTWTVPTLPDNWQELRDRWSAFHILRVVASLAGFVFLVVGAVY